MACLKSDSCAQNVKIDVTLSGQNRSFLELQIQENSCFMSGDKVSIDGISENISKDSRIPVRLIDFQRLVSYGRFPRLPNCDLTVELDDINRAESFIVFISHSWIRGEKTIFQDPHPDNEHGDKFKLCKEGIRKLWNIHAPAMNKCYIWMDYCCCNQNNVHTVELAIMKEIMGCCDAVFTPIVDKKPASFYSRTPGSYFFLYESELWSDPKRGYINRGWARLEMFYAAHLPVVNGIERHKKFKFGLAHACKQNRRMHVLYSTQESNNGLCPRVITPLAFSFYDELKPELGNFTKETDKYVVQFLSEELLPIMAANCMQDRYKGETNDKGERHGFGVLHYKNGDTYEGGWKNNKRDGRGCFTLSIGYVYDGEWVNDMRQGKGVAHYANGMVYEGEYWQDKCSGTGVMFEALGHVYRGEFLNGLFHGRGVMTYADGSVYEGIYEQGNSNGGGIMSVYQDEVNCSWDSCESLRNEVGYVYPLVDVESMSCVKNYCISFFTDGDGI